MLDIATADGLNADFYTPPINMRVEEHVGDHQSESLPIFGVSDGGAHTKFFTGGRYRDGNVNQVRARKRRSCRSKRSHFRLSAHPAMCAGFKNRGTLVEGAAADLIAYDIANLKILPMEVVHDFPGGEWRRVQRAEGYNAVMVNGEAIFEDDKETGAVPGLLLRHGG